MRIVRTVLGTCLFACCLDAGAAATNDPFGKLMQAEVLFQQQGRPLPAERLIFDALIAYQFNGDPFGIATAYREYADFLRSPIVAQFESYYKRHGFIDTSITFDNRLEKAKEFLGKALENYGRAATEFDKTKRFDGLTNVYLNMALIDANLGQKDQACLDFDHMLGAYQLNIQQTPSAQQYLPPGFSSMADYVAHERLGLGCKE